MEDIEIQKLQRRLEKAKSMISEEKVKWEMANSPTKHGTIWKGARVRNKDMVKPVEVKQHKRPVVKKKCSPVKDALVLPFVDCVGDKVLPDIHRSQTAPSTWKQKAKQRRPRTGQPTRSNNNAPKLHRVGKLSQRVIQCRGCGKAKSNVNQFCSKSCQVQQERWEGKHLKAERQARIVIDQEEKVVKPKIQRVKSKSKPVPLELLSIQARGGLLPKGSNTPKRPHVVKTPAKPLRIRSSASDSPFYVLDTTSQYTFVSTYLKSNTQRILRLAPYLTFMDLIHVQQLCASSVQKIPDIAFKAKWYMMDIDESFLIRKANSNIVYWKRSIRNYFQKRSITVQENIQCLGKKVSWQFATSSDNPLYEKLVLIVDTTGKIQAIDMNGLIHCIDPQTETLSVVAKLDHFQYQRISILRLKLFNPTDRLSMDQWPSAINQPIATLSKRLTNNPLQSQVLCKTLERYRKWLRQTHQNDLLSIARSEHAESLFAKIRQSW